MCARLFVGVSECVSFGCVCVCVCFSVCVCPCLFVGSLCPLQVVCGFVALFHSFFVVGFVRDVLVFIFLGSFMDLGWISCSESLENNDGEPLLLWMSPFVFGLTYFVIFSLLLA